MMKIRQLWDLNKFIILRDQCQQALVNNSSTLDPDQLKRDQACLDTISSNIERLKELLLRPDYLDED